VPAVHTYVDSRGYENHLCERHFRPLLRLARREAEREAKRRRGGILTAEDFLPRVERHDPDER
jgi:hypothetical protein